MIVSLRWLLGWTQYHQIFTSIVSSGSASSSSSASLVSWSLFSTATFLKLLKMLRKSRPSSWQEAPLWGRPTEPPTCWSFSMLSSSWWRFLFQSSQFSTPFLQGTHSHYWKKPVSSSATPKFHLTCLNNFSVHEFLDYEIVNRVMLFLNLLIVVSYPVNFAIYCSLSRLVLAT